MYTKSQLESMNNNKKYSSSGWIKNIDNIDNNKVYKIYATSNATLSSGREYIALPVDKILTEKDYIEYKIFK